MTVEHRSMQRGDSSQSGRRFADRLKDTLDGPSKTITVEPIQLPAPVPPRRIESPDPARRPERPGKPERPREPAH
jgi:hypothetical protein